MQSNICCKCANLDDLVRSSNEQNVIKLSFTLFYDEGKYFIRFQSEQCFEVISCWTCGGLELGDITSEEYEIRADCKCNKLQYFAQNENYPIEYNAEHNSYSLFVADDRSEDNLSILMLFCPFCSGKLFDRRSENFINMMECRD
jgi:hypothetical protein